jgi:hypothetical protein
MRHDSPTQQAPLKHPTDCSVSLHILSEVRPTSALRYDVGDEQQVKIRCGQLIATLYGQFFLGFGPRVDILARSAQSPRRPRHMDQAARAHRRSQLKRIGVSDRTERGTGHLSTIDAARPRPRPGGRAPQRGTALPGGPTTRPTRSAARMFRRRVLRICGRRCSGCPGGCARSLCCVTSMACRTPKWHASWDAASGSYVPTEDHLTYHRGRSGCQRQGR